MKYPTIKGVAELVGCQSMARNCMVATVSHCVVETDSSGVSPTL